MRRPMETMSQKQLTYEMRHAIDRARRRPGDSQAFARVRQLIAENPRSVMSTHVQHNIGMARRAWLAAHGGPLPIRREAHSLADFPQTGGPYG